MIKVKVTKNIIRNGTIFANLTLKQIVILLISLALSALLIVTLKDRMNFDLLMTIVFLQITVTMGFGIVRIQGMSLFKFMFLTFKGAEIRHYHAEGVMENERKIK